MDWFWNWGGECFGYREGDSLFTYFGKEVGRFDGEEIFGSNGRYLGEVMSENRLITSRSKKSWVRGSFGARRRVAEHGPGNSVTERTANREWQAATTDVVFALFGSMAP